MSSKIFDDISELLDGYISEIIDIYTETFSDDDELNEKLNSNKERIVTELLAPCLRFNATIDFEKELMYCETIMEFESCFNNCLMIPLIYNDMRRNDDIEEIAIEDFPALGIATLFCTAYYSIKNSNKENFKNAVNTLKNSIVAKLFYAEIIEEASDLIGFVYSDEESIERLTENNALLSAYILSDAFKMRFLDQRTFSTDIEHIAYDLNQDIPHLAYEEYVSELRMFTDLGKETKEDFLIFLQNKK